LYSKSFVEALRLGFSSNPILEFLSELPDKTPPVERMLAVDNDFLADHNLTYTDKMGMAEGVEIRVPFLDPDLVEFAHRIPLRYKQRGREGKWVLKKAMESYLSREVIYRPKAGFGAPLRRWMRHDLRELLLDYLSEESLRRRGFFIRLPCMI
jgi:asparagine synthase (glutamine-hydrolysing)